jgi:serine/threonine protein kinase
MTERFTLLTELGRGGMGVVWKACDEETGRIVALKLLRETYAEDPDYVTRFERELELAKRIHSRNAVQVLGYGVRDGTPYLALEYVDGPSLRKRLASHGPYGWPEAKALLAQIAQGLADAHAAGVIHRDLKPSNILIGSDGVPKIADFGIAKGLDLTRVTGTSTLLGTPAYLAPEGPADERSDLYSLGVIAYELLTGVVPFEGRTYQEVILRHVREAPDLNKLPAEARPTVGWLLAKDAAERPQSGHDLLPVLWGGTGAPAQPPVAQAAGPELATAQPVPAQPVFAQRPSPPAVATGAAVQPPGEPAKELGKQFQGWVPASPPVASTGPIWKAPPSPPPVATTGPIWKAPPSPPPVATTGPIWKAPPSALPPVAGYPFDPRRSRRSPTPGQQWLTAAGLLVCLVAAVMAVGFGLRLSTTSPPLTVLATETALPTPMPLPTPVSGTFTPGGSMTTTRVGQTATLLSDGVVLIVGGVDATGPSATAELYDPTTDAFSLAGSMAAARLGHTATLLSDGRVLVAGGCGKSACLATAELYNPATGKFSKTGSMATARESHTATLLPDGRVLVAGGDNQKYSTNTAELYNPATGKFSKTGSMTAFRASATATLLSDGRVLVVGGGAGSVLATAELYSPATGKFSPTGSMATSRFGHTATLLSDGRVLIAGGWTGSSSPTSAELYDPKTGAFSSTGSMATGRYGHTATLLSDGRVLIAGGDASAELYDPRTGAFSSTGSMAMDRSQHTATLLSDGRVLMAGGQNRSGVGSASAELYQP